MYASVLPTPITLEAILAGEVQPASSGTKFTITGNGPAAGYRVEFNGAGFSYDGDGLPDDAGSISSVAFFAPGNVPIITLSPINVTMSLGEFYQTLVDDGGTSALGSLLRASTFEGTTGDDRIGSFGEDTLIGGTGNDTFFALPGVALIEGGTSTGEFGSGETNRVVVQPSNYGGDPTILHNIQELDLNGGEIDIYGWNGTISPLKVVGTGSLGLYSDFHDASPNNIDLAYWDLSSFNGFLSIGGSSFNDRIVTGSRVANLSVSSGAGDDVVDIGRVSYAVTSGGSGTDFLRVDLSEVVESGEIGVSPSNTPFYFGASFSFTRFEQFDVIAGSGNDRLDGGKYDDTLRGGDGQDDVTGGGGNDVLDGGAGADRTSGNSGNDSLTGGAGLDLLSGDAGNDTLDGGSGIDQLGGGLGDDTYYASNRRDVLFEDADEGSDSVYASISWTLDDNFEQLHLTGGEGSSGIGNDLANVLVGNGAANVLDGGLGKDTITGGGGRDTFVFDTKLGAPDRDTIADFKHNKDIIALDEDIFSSIGGTLDKAEFYAAAGATKAHDKSDRIIYDAKSGKLYYDDDGSKKHGHDAVQFAVLSNKATLDHGDFVIV
jgi:Ca2+-binding RTX toxin-like protein